MSFNEPFVPTYANPDTTGKVIENQIAFSRYTVNNANEFLGHVQDSINQDQIQVEASDLANPDFALASLGNLTQLLTLLGNISVERPTFTAITGDVPDAPEVEFSDVPAVSVPTFTGSAPVLNIPSAPSSVLPGVPSAPALEDIALPTAPTYVLPTAPTFDTIQLPQPPSIALPVFSTTLPVDTLVVPTSTFTWAEAAYSSSLKDATVAKLLDNLQNGGYGIETGDEAALWDRERARQVEATEAQIDEIYRQGSARGFPLPPGDLNVSVQRAIQESSDKLSTVSRDIALRRSELYVDNRKFTIQEARSLETVLISYHSSVMERALNASKAVVEMGIALFNASVAKYNAQLDAYKTEATVFEAKIRAALAQVELYRTTMEGKRIELAAQTQQVELYRAQLGGINAIIDIYKTSVEAQVQRANVQRMRVEAFRAQIEAYTAQVQAKVGEAQIFEARIRGEVARVSAFEGEVRAYSALVEGAKVRSDTLLGNLRAETERAQAEARIYEARVQGFRATMDKQVEFIKAQLGEYQTDASVYSTRGNIYGDAARVGITQAQLEGQQRSKALDIVIENARNKLTALGKSADIRLSQSRVVGDYITQAVASSVGACNTISAITKTT